MHDMNNTYNYRYGLTFLHASNRTNSARVLPVDSVNTAPQVPGAEHQNDEQFENTLQAAVSILIDTKFQYAEQSPFRERLLVRLLQTAVALVKSVALKL